MLRRWIPQVFFSKRSRPRPRRPASRASERLACRQLEARELLSLTAHPMYLVLNHNINPLGGPGVGGYTPAQIQHAYGFDQISFNGTPGDGAGTTIAIVDAYDDPDIATDLATFDSTFGLPAPPSFTKVNETGGSTLPAPNNDWSGEISLDVEWAHSIAPAANILLVEATTNSYSDLFTAVQYAASQPNVVVVSMSFGGSEFSGETAYDSTFTTPAGHTNVAFVASSGDDGAPPSYPSISPNVLSTGGTSLTLDSAGNYISESAWTGSGGGISPYEPQPAYQAGVVTQSSAFRTNPDVSYDADPNTGYPVLDTYIGGWLEVGGTSACAPQWSAMIAIADQGRELAGLQPLDGPTQLLPDIYALPASDFHDVTTGSSEGTPPYAAGPGYDLATGIGSPLANKVVAALTVPPPHIVVSAPTTATANQLLTVTLTVETYKNAVDTTFTGLVQLSTSDSQAILPSTVDFTASDDGMQTFQIRLRTAGSDSITATDIAEPEINGSTSVTVGAGSAGGFRAIVANPLPPGDPFVLNEGAGVPFSLTLEATDAFGNPLANYSGTVHFRSSDSSAALPANFHFLTNDDGIANFKITLYHEYVQTVTVTDVLDSWVTSTIGINVLPGPVVGFKLSSTLGGPIASAARATVPLNFTLAAVDRYGNVEAGFLEGVKFSSTDPRAVLPAVYEFTAADKGQHTFDVVFGTVGSQTLKATEFMFYPNGTSPFSATASVLVSAGPPAGSPAIIISSNGGTLLSAEQPSLIKETELTGNTVNGFEQSGGPPTPAITSGSAGETRTPSPSDTPSLSQLLAVGSANSSDEDAGYWNYLQSLLEGTPWATFGEIK